MLDRIRTSALTLVPSVLLSGCGLLDVDNPNELVESAIRMETASRGVANGSLRLAGDAISDVWEAYLVASDELYWIGSRDAWGQLDQGFVGDPNNEFMDAAFPTLGRSVWMAREAVEIITEHVSNNAGDDDFALDLARAQMFYGMILMVTGEVQEDMTFSDMMTDGPPVGPANMYTVLDDAIAQLDDAVAGFRALGEDDREIDARALRARAHMSRAIWDVLNPIATVGGALDFGAARPDADFVLGAVGGDWQFDLDFSSRSGPCDMCGNVNDRKENQIDLSLVTLDGANDIDGIALHDPVSGEDDLALISRLNQWKGGSYLDSGDQYPSLTVASERLMQLIVAEDELSQGNGGPGGTFEAAINAIRDLDGEVAFVSGGAHGLTDLEFLQHSRRVNTLLMGLRLADMFRWGLQPTGNPEVSWGANSDAVVTPGEMLPITIIEIRANCHLNGQGCG